MKKIISFSIFSLLFLIQNHAHAELTDYFEDKQLLRNVTKKYVANFIVDICTKDWGIRGRVYKADSQIQVIFHDETGKNADLFLSAVSDLNHAFGYEKFNPQISATNSPVGESIVIYYGPPSKGRSKLRGFGAINASVKPWSFWSYWDNSKNRAISRTFGAISEEDIAELSLSWAIKCIILGASGFPGTSEKYPGLPQVRGGGIFSPSRYPGGLENSPQNQMKLITNFDRAVIRFVDRVVKTNSSRTNIHSLVQKDWDEFIQQFCSN